MKTRQRITLRTAAERPETTKQIPNCCLCFRVTLIIFSTFVGRCSAVGYSYSRFEGPVVGPEQLVTLPDAYGGGTHSDYVARPEYSFAYGIEDGQTRVLQNRKETRHGDEVRGVYSVVDPDGTLRVVKYTADDANGFQAEVITNGVARLHGHGSEGVAGAAVDEQVEHNAVNQQAANEVDDEDGDGEEEAEEQEEKQENPAKHHKSQAAKRGKGQYQVHEDYDGEQGEEQQNDKEEQEEEQEEGGGDHAEYEGSSEEGYEDAKPQEQEESSEEY